MLETWCSKRVSVIDSIDVFEVEKMYFLSSDENEKNLYADIEVIEKESTIAQWISRALRKVDVEAYQHKNYLSRLMIIFRQSLLFAQFVDESQRKKYRV